MPIDTTELLKSLTYPQGMERHIRSVLEGEYDTPYWTFDKPTVLDIGANVGSFSAWASQRWPGCKIFAFEPLSTNFESLKKNTLPLPNVQLFNLAVGTPGIKRLYLGKNNCGEGSFFQMGEQQDVYEEVQSISPKQLPTGNILKLDVEGSEVMILSGLPKIDYDAIMLEWHGEESRREIDRLLPNYTLVGAECRLAHRGVVKYMRSDLLESRLGPNHPRAPQSSQV